MGTCPSCPTCPTPAPCASGKGSTETDIFQNTQTVFNFANSSFALLLLLVAVGVIYWIKTRYHKLPDVDHPLTRRVYYRTKTGMAEIKEERDLSGTGLVYEATGAPTARP